MATIRSTADKVPATVAGFGKVKDGNYGPYQSVLFEGDRLPEGKVWRSMEPEQTKQFTRGQRVYLVPTKNKQGKDSWDIELMGDAPAAPAQQPAQGQANQRPAYPGRLGRSNSALASGCRGATHLKLPNAGAARPARR